MKVSLIMPTFNCWALTDACLESLWPTLPAEGFELVVVDDASTDETPVRLAAMQDRLRYFPQNKNGGYSTACNLGVAEATGEFLLIINNDLIFQPGWWEPLLEVFSVHPDAGVVGNVQWSPLTRRFDHMGVIFDGTQPIHFGERFRINPFSGVTRWGAVTACCWAIRRDLFLSEGGFDVEFLTGYEDIDFCLRLGEKGHHHYVQNRSVIQHYVSSSPNRHTHTKENAHRFFTRWGENIARSWAKADDGLTGWNFLLRTAMNPGEFNAHATWRALKRVLFADSTARSLWSLR